MKIFFFCFALISSVFVSSAQDAEAERNSTQPKTIVDDFNEIVDESGSWKDYKIIKKTQVTSFTKQLKENSEAFEAEISSLENEISNQAKEVKDLKNQLAEVQNNLVEVKEEKDSMQFLGSNLNKSLFQTIVFGIIGVLILVLIIVMVKFKSNSAATNEALDSLSSTEKDFEEYKRNSLEKQQVLGRQLLDEKNKVSKLKSGGTN
jgi:preprotein translocase subunit SecF